MGADGESGILLGGTLTGWAGDVAIVERRTGCVDGVAAKGLPERALVARELAVGCVGGTVARGELCPRPVTNSRRLISGMLAQEAGTTKGSPL